MLYVYGVRWGVTGIWGLFYLDMNKWYTCTEEFNDHPEFVRGRLGIDNGTANVIQIDFSADSRMGIKYGDPAMS